MKKIFRMRIGQLERASGVPRSTIHHYLREGLLHPPQKTGKTMAYYDESHLKRLSDIQRVKLDFLRRSKRSRMPIDVIKHNLYESAPPSIEEGSYTSGSSESMRSRHDRKKQEIIEATMHLYLEKGYYQTNLRDIAGAMGMSPSTFYIYFSDKRELFAEVIENVVSRAISEIEDAWRDEKDGLKRMIALTRVFNKFYPKFGGILNQLRAGAANNDEWARERLQGIYREVAGFLSRELERAMKAGVIRETDAELLSFVILGGADMMSQRAALDDKYTPEQILAFWFDCFLRIARPDSP